MCQMTGHPCLAAMIKSCTERLHFPWTLHQWIQIKSLDRELADATGVEVQWNAWEHWEHCSSDLAESLEPSQPSHNIEGNEGNAQGDMLTFVYIQHSFIHKFGAQCLFTEGFNSTLSTSVGYDSQWQKEGKVWTQRCKGNWCADIAVDGKGSSVREGQSKPLSLPPCSCSRSQLFI